MRQALGTLTDRYSREVWMLCAVSALGAGAYLGMHQLLTALYVLRLGYGPATVGSLSATGSMSFSASSLLGGLLGTRLGSRRTMLLGVGIFVAGMSLLPLAGAVPAPWRLPYLFVEQVITSMGWSMQVVSVIASMAGVTTITNRRAAYALREACSSVGMLLGAFIGGLLPGGIARLAGVTTEMPGPYGLALWVSVLIGAATILPVRAVATAPDAPTITIPLGATAVRGSTGQAVRFRLDLALALLMACGFATNAAHSACKTFASVYMDTVFHLPTSLIGTITSAGMGLTAVAALSSTRLGRRRSGGQMMVIGALGIGAALLVMAMVPSPFGAVAGVVGVYGVLGLWRPAYQSLQMETARPEFRTLVSGASAMGMSLGFGSMGFVGGYIATGAGGYPAVFLAGAGAAVVSAALGGVLSRRGVAGGN